ncbi:unnamed protein product (mitochondrion) [Plasmodiophora brassicae]|uniref:Non-specific serine/threonine protein kinase n=1 Tax=Plasmodiophora brassicae TaxID=37360 RepID=A0A0G4IWN1_PLABS|nr:hypothetical protein PBRA_007360 [Plasmodiophora brassicae]SPQ98036.1 unnamed protein product [Plasmodiophora brassicae]
MPGSGPAKVVIRGYLRKKSPKGLVGLTLWQRRYFILYDNVLTYSKENGEDAKNQGAIPIHEMVAVKRVPKDPCRFDIIIASRVFSLLASTPADVDEWVDAVAAQIKLVKGRARRSHSNSDPDRLPTGKFWKDTKGVLDDLNSPSAPSASTASNAFTRIDLSQLQSLSNGPSMMNMRVASVTVPPMPSTDDLPASPAANNSSSKGSLGALAAHHEPTSSLAEMRFQIADMTVKKILGQGQFGTLCVVENAPTGNLYMMQRVKADLATATMAVDAMRRMAAFNNPYIMQCLDFEVTPDESWAVYEFVQGGTLFQHLRAQRRLPEDVVRFLAAEVVCAVRYLHRKGNLFRNMDPEHIGIDITGHVVLTDFRVAMDTSANVTPCRNPEYRSPEFVTVGIDTADSDWWRLGILIYELLVGFPPFRDQNADALNEKILSCSVRYPPFMSPDATALLGALLQVDTTKRLGSGPNGFRAVHAHAFFKDVDWRLVDVRNQDVPDAMVEQATALSRQHQQ